MAAQAQTFTENQTLVIRRATPADAAVCGRICFEAFGTLAEKHKFPPDFPSPEIPIHVLSMMFSHPSFFCVVAEQDGWRSCFITPKASDGVNRQRSNSSAATRSTRTENQVQPCGFSL